MPNKKYHFFLIIIFLLILSFPFLGGILGLNKQPVLNENRTLAKKPKLSDFWNFLINYQTYFKDNFPFRSTIIETDHLLRIKLFNTSPNNSVVLGKENWLFYVPDDTLIDTINGHPFTQTELSEIQKNLETTQRYFENQNISYYFLVAPNAQTIYSEFLPNNLIKANPQSRLEQLTNYLNKNNAKVNFINPTPELLKSKNDAQLYRKFDTHWNEYGAFIAYSTLFKKISQTLPNLTPHSVNDYQIQYSPSQRIDLQLQIGLNGYYTEKEPYFTLKDSPQLNLLTEPCSKPYNQCAETIYEQNQSALPKLVMYRDSFATSLIPFIIPHFQRSHFIWKVTPYSLDEINQDKPDIVVVELTERELWRLTDKLFSF